MKVTIQIDSRLIDDAAAALDLEGVAGTPGAVVAAVLRQVAGTRKLSAIAEGGRAPKRAGREFERAMIDYANSRGRQWDYGPLRGARDLLDVTGCLPAGWLVGAKSTQRGVPAARKLSDAMDQAARALEYLPQVAGKMGFFGPAVADVIPWQVIQRPGAPMGRNYAVTEYDHMLKICDLRERGWNSP